MSQFGLSVHFLGLQRLTQGVIRRQFRHQTFRFITCCLWTVLNLGNGIPDSGSLFPETWGALGNKIRVPCSSALSHSLMGTKRRQSEVVLFWFVLYSPTRHARRSKPHLAGLTGRRGRREAGRASGIALTWARPGDAGEICRVRLKVSTSSPRPVCGASVGGGDGRYRYRLIH